MLAVGTTTALLAFTSGAGAAFAAPGDTSNATGQALSGALFDLPLSPVLDLGEAAASNDGTQPTVTDGGDIDLTALSLLNIQLPGGLNLPLNVADVDVLTQQATANPDGSSAGSSGIVGGVNFSLGGLLGGLGLNPAFLSEVAALNVGIGALSAEASQAAPAAAVGDYTIADADLTFQSATLGGIVTALNNTVSSTQTLLDELEVGIEANLLTIPGLPAGLVEANATVAVPSLADTVSSVLETTLSSGGVTIDLTTGLVSVDLALLNDLNNLPESANLLGAPQLTAITTNITNLVSGLVDDVGTALQSTIDGIAVTGGVTITVPPVLPFLPPIVLTPITIDTSLGELLDGDTSGISLGTIPLDLGIVGDLILEPLLGAGDLGNVIGILSPVLLTPVINLVVPAITPVLSAAIGLTANVQTTTAGVFSQTALRVTVLPGGPAVQADFANATVGPNAAVPNPAIASIVPSQGPEAGGTPVTLTGTDFTNVTSVTIGGNVVTDLTVTPTTIDFVTPPHVAGAVDVVVNALQGDSAPAQFTYLAVPAALASLTPDEGTEAGGTPVTITGSGFIGSTGVTFNGNAATDVVVVNDTTITATSPAGTVGPVPVVVQDPAGDSGPLTYNYIAVASVASTITPTSGPVVGGTPVVIAGSGFLGSTGVEFDGVPGTGFVIDSDTQISVTTPPGALGVADVVVLDPIDDSAPLDFTYTAQPAIALSLDPTSGTELGGTIVTIDGSGFTGATDVTFDGVPGTEIDVVDDTTITVLSPAHVPGPVSVIVVDPAGNSAPLEYTYVGAAAAVDSIDPTEGPETGGTVVTIEGSGFTNTTGVTFDGVLGTNYTVVDDGTIRVTSPAHTPGVVDVIVLDPSGNSAPEDFEYLAIPSAADSLDPTEGTELGGTIVTIDGSGFTGATDVTFDGVPGTAFTVVDDNTISVTSPPGTPGIADVVVLDPAGDSAPLDFEYLATPAVAESLDPTEGPASGGTEVVISGTGFTGATGVTFDGVLGTGFVVNSDLQITVTSPAGTAGIVDVIVIDGGGNSAPLDFEYLAEPAVALSLDPTSGSEDGGTVVEVTGSGSLGATGVTFDGIAGTDFDVVDDTTILVTSPAHVPGPVSVIVVDPAGNSAPLEYTYVGVAAVIDSIDPTEGPETGGTVVTIEGSGFTNATGVTFDGVLGTNYTFVDDGTIRVTSPAHAPGVVDLVVLDPSGNSAPEDFEYLAVASAALSLDPDEGNEIGGTPVTIDGTGFLGASGVTFDGVPGTAFVVVNDTTITVTSPAGAPGIADVVVLDPAGDSDPLDFEYLSIAAVAASLNPTSGPSAGGTEVIITGTGFTGATGVNFDGNLGTGFVVDSDTQITVISPPGEAGLIDVIVLDPAGNSAPLDFEYDPQPSITDSLDPTSGTELGGTLVTITGSGFIGATGVTFDGIPGTEFDFVNDTTITVLSPAHAPGEVDVVVVDAAGNSGPLDYEFLAIASEATSLDPTSGTELGGTLVTITGSGFTGATKVIFDGIPGAEFDVVDDTTITVLSPVHAPGTVDVFVVDVAGNGGPLEYEFLAIAAEASSLTPTEGPVVGGTEVTIIGTGFTGATGVTFDGTLGTGFIVDSDTQITVTSPAGALGLADVIVVDPAGNSEPLDFEYTAQPAIAASLDPTSGTELGGTTVTVTGSGFLGATAVTFDGTPGTTFTVVNDTTITVLSPEHLPGLIDVVVIDPAGNSGPLDYEFLGFPSVAASITPDEGTEAGGTSVTITGSGFTGANAVTFDGTDGTEFDVVNDNTITVISPAHAPGLVDVIVVDGSGNSAPLDYEYLAVAAGAASLTPTEGTEAGGTGVTITGTGFLGATGVEFDGAAGTEFIVVDDTTITVTTPAHTPGVVDVVVLDPAGNSEPLDYEYLAVAADAGSLSPTEGPVVGGTPVTITGTGFLGATGVTFDGTPGTEFTVVSDTEIIVTSPAGDLGIADVVVLDPAGDSDPLDFEYLAQAAGATSLTPVTGTELGGTTVTITGSGFLGATGVEFDGSVGTDFTVVNDTTITVETPAHAPGLVDVIVLDPAGNSASLEFTYVGIASVVDTIDPTEGPETGGTPVTITGSGFTGATGVTFGGIPGTEFTVVNDTTITVTTPANLPGTVDVVVLDPTADSTPVDFTYVAVAAEAVSIDPTEGTELGGTSVTITGTGFLGATGVEFDGLVGTEFTVVDDTSITVSTPAHAPGGVDVVVIDPAGDSEPLDFEYLAIASDADSLDPTFGPAEGGTVVTIIGSGFTGATGVEFDGTPGTDFTVVDDTTITVTTPAHSSGIVEVIVLDPAGDSDPLDFEYGAEAATAASITPGTGSEAGGTEVTISGSGFTGASGVTFDGLAGTTFTVVDDETITVVTPAHAPGLVDVIVVDAAGSSAPLGFTYFPLADIEVVDPSTGPEAGGTTVTIVGTCFTGASAVLFGDTEVTDFEVSADGTTITVVSPAGVGTVDVTVVGTAECGTTTEEGGYTYEPAPAVVDTIDPPRGPQTGGTTVTIIGDGFTGSTGVEFGGVPGTDFTVVDDNTITVVTPPAAAGTVEVVVLDPAGNSAPVDFEYYEVGGIDTVSPSTGPSSGGTTVTISGQCFTGATDVRFGNNSAKSFSVNAAGTQIKAVTPAGSGTVDVTVIGADDCGSTTLDDAFQYTTFGLPSTGVEIAGAALSALLLLVGGAFALVIRRREQGEN